MSTSFTYSTQNGQYSIAEVDYKRMSGQPGVGFYRWLLGLSLHQATRVGAENRRIGLRAINGELLAMIQGGGEFLIARFFQPDQRVFEPYDHTHGTEFYLETELDVHRIFAIEKLRQGGDFQVKLKLRAIAFDCSTMVPNSVEAHEIGFQITQSDWIKVLKGMNYRNTLLLELEEPKSLENPDLTDAVQHLTDAHSHLSRGHFKAVVAECRHALEVAKPFFRDEGSVPEVVKEWLKTDHTMTKEQRLARIGVLLRKLTSLVHHSDETTRATEWSPEDARAILAMTSAILQMVPGSRE